MRLSWPVIVASSASLSSSRASRARWRTSSADRDTVRLQVGRHLEGRAPLGPLDPAAADALDADAQGLDGAAHLALDGLQVGLEGPAADAGDLAADAAEVLGLAAAGVVVAQDRFLAADGTLHAHADVSPFGPAVAENVYY